MLRGLFGNLKLKILSVVLGVCTWWVISRELPKKPVKTRDFDGIPVQVIASGKSTGSVDVSPDKVTVRLRGPSKILDDLSSSQMVACVRIAEGQSGVQITRPAIFLSPDLAQQGVTVVGFPRKVRVEISAPPQ